MIKTSTSKKKSYFLSRLQFPSRGFLCLTINLKIENNHTTDICIKLCYRSKKFLSYIHTHLNQFNKFLRHPTACLNFNVTARMLISHIHTFVNIPALKIVFKILKIIFKILKIILKFLKVLFFYF